jgi:hypothetical protein
VTALTDRAASALALRPFGIFSLGATLASPAKLVKPLPDVCNLKPVKPLLSKMRDYMDTAECFTCLIGLWRGVRADYFF